MRPPASSPPLRPDARVGARARRWLRSCLPCTVFFCQAEDGIRGGHVTGVQTCALPIYRSNSAHVAECAGGSASRESWLRCQPKNLLPPRVGRRRRHHHHDSPRLSIHPAADAGDGSSCRQRSLSVRARFADSRWRRTARWYALVEIRFEPLADVRGEFSHWRETIGVSHRLSRLFAPTVGAAAAANKLRRF